MEITYDFEISIKGTSQLQHRHVSALLNDNKYSWKSLDHFSTACDKAVCLLIMNSPI